jgi:hypothetical protein
MMTIKITSNVDRWQLTKTLSKTIPGFPVWNNPLMVTDAIDHTAVIFANSLLTGFSKSHQVFRESEAVIHWGGLVIALLGGYYVISGFFWFF